MKKLLISVSLASIFMAHSVLQARKDHVDTVKPMLKIEDLSTKKVNQIPEDTLIRIVHKAPVKITPAKVFELVSTTKNVLGLQESVYKADEDDKATIVVDGTSYTFSITD